MNAEYHEYALSPRKRAFDIVVALLLVIPTIAICAILAVAIWLDDQQNPVFSQRRLGRAGREFQLLKLRTMHIDTADRPSHEVGAKSITRIGALLRRTKLDELPQVFNVLRGEMSFVGPRPGLPSQEQLRDFRRRLGVDQLVPGITGVAQVQGLDMSAPEALARAEASYLIKWSLRRDLHLLLQTVTGKGRGDPAVW